MVVCNGEADLDLAKQASGNPNMYVLGQDSDFFFYHDIQYVPFHTLAVEPRGQGLLAHVYTRQSVATSLGLEEDLMVELAILMGNDYVDPKTSDSSLAAIGKDSYNLLEHLCNQDDGYRVTSADPEVQTAMDFSRALYNLQELSQFAEENTPGQQPMPNEEEEEEQLVRLAHVPRAFLDLAQFNSKDRSVRDAWMRSIQMMVDQLGANDSGESTMVLTQEHVDACRQIAEKRNTTSLEVRPQWGDVLAAHILETCVSTLLSRNQGSFLVRGTSPSSLFHHATFHAILASNRQQHESGETQDEPVPEIEPPPVERITLPIDEYEENIIGTIRDNRVTIIHGETGCGKSSRVPIMLLNAPPPDPTLKKHKLFISQPRRIAAKALVERVRSCEPEHSDKFALRMGHGWREYETKKTQAWFVTTGYLTRLLANHPERFDDCTHLVIDEVHERSVDTDILCLLCRRLLENNKTIRLVLMSATLATKLYKDYFNVPNEPIHVGVRRYPITEHFVEDLRGFELPPAAQTACRDIQKECESVKCNSAPGAKEMKNRFALAARLTSIVGRPGSSVLIFVPGMNDILAITELIEGFYMVGVRFTCFPIHSDIPFEDQMAAFDKPEADEVKVIIATNAAESSVTLPDVDHVICLGLCKQIVYNPASHRQMLVPCWISRASATQRAGRTGRVRPGNVYRLYTRHAYESYMDEFEPGEMVRIPLDSVILMLKEMLHEEVKPVLLSCIEPPNMDTIERSFQSLHKWNYISEPDDHGEITTLGSFVSSLGIDLAFGSFIGLGIQFGVAAEAIEMAAAMSFPKTPFQITSPLIHTPAQYNEIGSNTYVAKCHFDANLYSEPLGLMNLMWDYGIVENKNQFCMHYRIAYARMRQLVSARDSQRKRVADFLGINEDRLRMEVPPAHMPQAKITVLRLLQVWVFSDTMIECAPTTSLKKSPNGSMSLTLSSNSHALKEEHLAQVLDSDRHPHTIASIQRIDQAGTFVRLDPFHFESFVDEFEPRLLSYVIAEDVGLAWCFDEYNLNLYVREEHAIRNEFMKSLGSIVEYSTHVFLLAEEHKNTKRRGVFERKCGSWEVSHITGARAGRGAGAEQLIFRKYTIRGNDRETLLFLLSDEAFPIGDGKSTVAWNFCSRTKGRKKKKDKNDASFVATSRGECSQVSKVDLQDLLGTSNLSSTLLRKDANQSLVFHNSPNVPFPFKGKEKDNLATGYSLEASSWSRPLIDDIPEGARLLSTLASGYRKGRNSLRFKPSDEENSDSIEFPLKKEETLISNRWKRLGSGSPVYVPENTVPASATSISRRLYACCSNTLEVGGGGLRVEGLTLLPPNPVFVLLSFLSFGLKPTQASGFESFSFEPNEDCDDREDKTQVKKWMKWLRERWERTPNQESRASIPIFVEAEHQPDEEEHGPAVKEDAKRRIRMALEFHRSCADLSEELVCFPDKVNALCKLFNDLDGHTTSQWDSLEERSLTRDNLLRWKHEKKTSTGGETRQAAFPPRTPRSATKRVGKSPGKEGLASTTKSETKVRKGVGNNGSDRTKKNADININTGDIIEPAPKKERPSVEPAPTEERHGEKWLHGNILRQFPQDVTEQSRRLFTTQLGAGEQIASDEFASTNILSLLVQVYGGLLVELSMDPSKNRKIKEKSEIGLSSKDWTVICYNDPQGKPWYQAKFVNNVVPKIPIFGRGKNKLPKWMKKHDRPSRTEDAMACVPGGTNVVSLTSWEAKTSKDGVSVLFESIDAALRMEAAFWLERQFCIAGKAPTRRWFHHLFQEMVHILQKYTEQTDALNS
jgi:HrpA-like RNA helicase